MTKRISMVLCAAFTLTLAGTSLQGAVLLTNGGFESGLGNWTRADQLGSDGSFFLQSGVITPVSLQPVPAPPQGSNAAMTDSQGPGSHVLYQDFLVPLSVINASINFSLFVNNQALAFTTPESLDFSTPALNQQARVDILGIGVDPLTAVGSNVLQNLYRTNVGDPLVSGYTNLTIDITALLQAHLGQTLRLRFAEVDNVAGFNFGVDNVAITTDVAAGIPEPSTWLLCGGALFGMAIVGASRRRR